MPTLNELTVDQFRALMGEFFATPEKRQKMTHDEITELAHRLNQKINVPIITETGEEKILIKIILTIDTFLYDHLPNEFYDLVRSMDKGIDDGEAERLIIRLSKLANEKIDLPYLPEAAEYIAIRFVIAAIINAARKNLKFTEAAEKVEALAIPDTAEANEADLRKLVA